jgi:small conductance mechanosensitive channel
LIDSAVILASIEAMIEGLLARFPYVVVGLIVWLLFFIAGRIVRGTMRLAGDRTQLDPLLARLLGSLASVALSILGLLIAAVVVFPTFRPGDLLAGLGITSVALGFAFKDILQNWLAGVFILWRRPFHIGDEIRTRDYEGRVESINVRSTILRTYAGERLVVPNSDVYTHAVLVRTACESRRVRFTVGVGYLDSLEEARAVLRRVLEETEGVLREPKPWVHVLELAASEVKFAVYFWVRPEQANALAVSDRVATRIKTALDDAGIDIPYPHTVVLFHDATGSRPGDRAHARESPQERGAAPALTKKPARASSGPAPPPRRSPSRPRSS